LPDLILVDINMPRLDGLQVVEWLRKQPGLKRLPVIILTSSDLPRDIQRAYELGANSFLVKPVDFERFVEISQALKGYWLWLSKAPEVQRPLHIESDRPRPPISPTFPPSPPL